MHSAAFIPCEIYTTMFPAVIYITYGTEYLSYLRQDIFHFGTHNKKKVFVIMMTSFSKSLQFMCFKVTKISGALD